MNAQPNLPAAAKTTNTNFSGGVGNTVKAETVNYGNVTNNYSTPKNARLNRLEVDNSFPHPSNAAQYVAALKTHRVILLLEPAGWGANYLADYLAITCAEPDPDEPYSRYIYSLAGDANIQTLKDTLHDPNWELTGAVIIISNAESISYRADQIEALAQDAQKTGCYLILTSTESLDKWAIALDEGQKQTIVFWLRDQSPYSTDNLIAWLMQGLIAQAVPLYDTGIVTELPISLETTIGNTGLSVRALVDKLDNPGRIQAFLNVLRGKKRASDVTLELLETIDNTENRLLRWFLELLPEERYLVLTISLISGLPGRALPLETFWAIYEILVHDAWRVREEQLDMIDYLTVHNRLSEYIQIDAQSVRFRIDNDRRAIIALALDNYRRALLQAMPILADIVTSSYGAATINTQTISGQLPILDIFGSTLEPRRDNLKRQDTLRENLAVSIAQIAGRERSTAEHLLLAWAEGVKDNEDINDQRQLAVSRTLVQLYLLELSPLGAGKTLFDSNFSLQLLLRWFTRYHPTRYRDFSVDTLDAQSNVRATIGRALCHIGRLLNSDLFGSVSASGSVKTKSDWLKMPVTQPTATDVREPLMVLNALIWDPKPVVRMGVVNGILELAQNEMLRGQTQALVSLLATDWNWDVRWQLANTLSQLTAYEPTNIYLIDYLFDHPDLWRARKISDKNHYLYPEANRASAEKTRSLFLLDELLPLVTSTVAMFLLPLHVSTQDPAYLLDIFKVYLKTRLTDPRSNAFRVFKAALCDYFLNDSGESSMGQLWVDLMYDNIFEALWLDARPDNQLTEAGKLLEQTLRSHISRRVPRSWLGQLLGHVWCTLFFRPKSRQVSPVFTMTELAEQFIIRSTPQGRLILAFINSANPKVQQRTREFLDSIS